MIFTLPMLLVIVAFYFVVLLVLGVAVGWCTAKVLRGDGRGLGVDALLAPAGYLVAAIMIANPRFQGSRYADALPIPASFVLPVVHQIYRRWRSVPGS